MRRLVLFHRWFGLVTAALVLVPAVTAILLNHRTAWVGPARGEGPPSPFDQYVLSTAVDPLDARRIWIGASEGLFRSDDGGRTFAEVALPVPARQVNSVVIDPNGRVYVALRYNGALTSVDGGRSWTALEMPAGESISALALAPDGGVQVVTSAGLRHLGGSGALFVARPPARSGPRSMWLQRVYDLHDGQFWGPWGVWVTDAASAAIVLLVGSGVVMFARSWRRREPVDVTTRG